MVNYILHTVFFICATRLYIMRNHKIFQSQTSLFVCWGLEAISLKNMKKMETGFFFLLLDLHSKSWYCNAWFSNTAWGQLTVIFFGIK